MKSDFITCSVKAILVGTLIAILMLAGMSSAAEKQFGRQLTLTLRDGRTIDGELLSVIDDRLIVFDANSRTSTDICIGEVSEIFIHKKSKILLSVGLGIAVGAGLGALAGYASGDSSGVHIEGLGSFLKFPRKQLAVAGAISGGFIGLIPGLIIGSILSSGTTIDLEKTPAPDTTQILNRLSVLARNQTHIMTRANSEPAGPTDLSNLSADQVAENIAPFKKALEKDSTSKLSAGFSLSRPSRRLY